jgi:hypothetical protein
LFIFLFQESDQFPTTILLDFRFSSTVENGWCQSIYLQLPRRFAGKLLPDDDLSDFNCRGISITFNKDPHRYKDDSI